MERCHAWDIHACSHTIQRSQSGPDLPHMHVPFISWEGSADAKMGIATSIWTSGARNLGAVMPLLAQRSLAGSACSGACHFKSPSDKKHMGGMGAEISFEMRRLQIFEFCLSPRHRRERLDFYFIKLFDFCFGINFKEEKKHARTQLSLCSLDLKLPH